MPIALTNETPFGYSLRVLESSNPLSATHLQYYSRRKVDHSLVPPINEDNSLNPNSIEEKVSSYLAPSIMRARAISQNCGQQELS